MRKNYRLIESILKEQWSNQTIIDNSEFEDWKIQAIIDGVYEIIDNTSLCEKKKLSKLNYMNNNYGYISLPTPEKPEVFGYWYELEKMRS